MASLSSDTGGKAFFDSNDFSGAFSRIQNDTSAYYVLGFHSTDLRRDGRYRRLSIKVDRSDVKLEYRPGYYAPADYQHATKDERERQLEEELASDLPATDMAVYMQALYFRLAENRFYVPISLVVPGSQIPFVKGGDRDKATLDIIGQVRDPPATTSATSATPSNSPSTSRSRCVRKTCSTPPASTCPSANITSSLSSAKTKPAAWAPSKPTSPCPTSKRSRSR